MSKGDFNVGKEAIRVLFLPKGGKKFNYSLVCESPGDEGTKRK